MPRRFRICSADGEIAGFSKHQEDDLMKSQHVIRACARAAFAMAYGIDRRPARYPHRRGWQRDWRDSGGRHG